MTTENGGRETGLSHVFTAVLESLAETMDDSPMVTNAACDEFLDSLNIRGYQVTTLGCRPHEWSDTTAEAFCMSCGDDRPRAFLLGVNETGQ